MTDFDDEGKCEDCGKVKYRVIARISLPKRPKLCDSCFDERIKR